MTHLILEELYNKAPPPFGHELRKYFAFDPEYTNLNHGSYGSVPRPVLQAVDELSLKIEANPDLFMRLRYQSMLIDVRKQLANLIGANVDDCVLVTNVSVGINTVLRNFDWQEGDTLVVFNTTYNSIFCTTKYLSDITPHPSVITITIQYPCSDAEIISRFRDHLRLLPVAPNKKRVAVIDSIISNPGVLFPWKEIVKICKDEGIWTVVDAAHSIGQELGINLAKVDPDFWVSNCHKWLYAKRSCAILYVAERNQHIIKSPIPTSPFYLSPQDRTGPNFVEQFEWTGTIDWVPFLTVPAALDFRNWLGGEEKVNAYCHDLALKGGKRLAEVMGTTLLDPTGDITLNMVNVELPLPGTIKYSTELDLKMKIKMLEQRNMYSAHFYHNGRWWTRCSAQVWLEVADFEKLGKGWVEVCEEIQKEIREKNVNTV